MVPWSRCCSDGLVPVLENYSRFRCQRHSCASAARFWTASAPSPRQRVVSASAATCLSTSFKARFVFCLVAIWLSSACFSAIRAVPPPEVFFGIFSVAQLFRLRDSLRGGMGTAGADLHRFPCPLIVGSLITNHRLDDRPRSTSSVSSSSWDPRAAARRWPPAWRSRDEVASRFSCIA